jgi:hypothetical protein
MKGKYENFSQKDWTAWLLRVELLSKEVIQYTSMYDAHLWRDGQEVMSRMREELTRRQGLCYWVRKESSCR